jgi:hypothetical protein
MSWASRTAAKLYRATDRQRRAQVCEIKGLEDGPATNPAVFLWPFVHKSKDSKAVQSTVPKCNAPGILWDPLGCRAEIEDS